MKTLITALALLLVAAASAPARIPGDAAKAMDEGNLREAQAILASAVDTNPDDAETRFAYAKVLAWNGRTRSALEQVTVLRAKEPNNADYQVLEARTRSWGGEDEAAVKAITATVRNNPRHEDAARAKIEILMNAGRVDDAAAARADAVRRFSSAEFPDPDADAGLSPGAQKIIDSAPSRFAYVSAWFAASSLSDGYDDWSEYAAIAAMDFDGGQRAILRAAEYQRFTDTDLELTATGIISPDEWVYAGEFAVSPTNQFLPKWRMAATAGRPLPKDFAASVRLGYADYDGDAFTSLSFTGEMYAPTSRDAYTITFAQLANSAVVATHRLSTMLFYGVDDMGRMELFGAYGVEVEDAGVRIDSRTVTTIGTTGRHMMTDSLGFDWSLIRSRVERAYTRLEIGVGFTWHY